MTATRVQAHSTHHYSSSGNSMADRLHNVLDNNTHVLSWQQLVIKERFDANTVNSVYGTYILVKHDGSFM